VVFPHLAGMVVEQVDGDDSEVRIWVRSRQAGAACPDCGTVSAGVHSRYQRRLTDRPISGRPVALVLTVRRLFCPNADCSRRMDEPRVRVHALVSDEDPVEPQFRASAMDLRPGRWDSTRLSGLRLTPCRDRVGSQHRRDGRHEPWSRALVLAVLVVVRLVCAVVVLLAICFVRVVACCRSRSGLCRRRCGVG
jgi:transposase